MKFITKREVAWASSDDQFVIETKDWRFQKPVIEESKCSHCGICSLFCPSGCIEEVEKHYIVDLEYCKGCGICARLCPKNAIQMEIETVEY